jgi:hypothetical protein
VLVHPQGELGVHGLRVEAPDLDEGVVDQGLRDAVVHRRGAKYGPRSITEIMTMT